MSKITIDRNNVQKLCDGHTGHSSTVERPLYHCKTREFLGLITIHDAVTFIYESIVYDVRSGSLVSGELKRTYKLTEEGKKFLSNQTIPDGDLTSSSIESLVRSQLNKPETILIADRSTLANPPVTMLDNASNGLTLYTSGTVPPLIIATQEESRW